MRSTDEFGFIYKMTENTQDTEDVLQNTFIKAYHNYASFRNESKLSTWIYRIAVHESYRHMKSWNKLPVVSITEKLGLSEEEYFQGLEYTPDFEDRIIVEEMREKCLRGFLRCIPQNMRVCFLLKTCLELRNKEITDIMGISEANVKITLYRARKRIKEMLEDRCSLIDPDKPCKCYYWLKYMKDHNLPLPNEPIDYRDEVLKSELFNRISLLKKIEFLYHTQKSFSYQDFIEKIKIISKNL